MGETAAPINLPMGPSTRLTCIMCNKTSRTTFTLSPPPPPMVGRPSSVMTVRQPFHRRIGEDRILETGTYTRRAHQSRPPTFFYWPHFHYTARKGVCVCNRFPFVFLFLYKPQSVSLQINPLFLRYIVLSPPTLCLRLLLSCYTTTSPCHSCLLTSSSISICPFRPSYAQIPSFRLPSLCGLSSSTALAVPSLTHPPY